MKPVPIHPTSAMVQAAEEAYMPFGDMELAIQMAILEAPVVEQDPVGWQYYECGKWMNGDHLTRNQRKNLEEVGIPTRDLYPAPQPVEQQPAPDVEELVEALDKIAAWPDGGSKYGQKNIKSFSSSTLAAYHNRAKP